MNAVCVHGPLRRDDVGVVYVLEEGLEGVGLGGREERHGGHHIGCAGWYALLVLVVDGVRGRGKRSRMMMV